MPNLSELKAGCRGYPSYLQVNLFFHTCIALSRPYRLVRCLHKGYPQELPVGQKEKKKGVFKNSNIFLSEVTGRKLNSFKTFRSVHRLLICIEKCGQFMVIGSLKSNMKRFCSSVLQIVHLSQIMVSVLKKNASVK